MSWFKRLFGKPEMPAVPDSAPSRSAAEDSTPEFPFPLVAVPGNVAEQEWRRLQTAWRAEGCSAVVLGDREDVNDRRESMQYEERTPDAIVAAVAANSAESFFARRRKEYADDELDLPDDDWPTQDVSPPVFTAHTHLSNNKPKPLVYIARVPTRHPWEVPAFLKIGGWNDCPAADDQVAVLRYWSERHDIEIFSATGDVLECAAARPPATREAALKLAREQFLYCSDIVHQGTETIAVLAATLLNSRVWFFWWD